MPHPIGPITRYLLAVLALASPLLVQADEGKLAPVVNLNPRHGKAASVSLDQPKPLVVAAQALRLLDETHPTTVPEPQPAVRSAAFDPTATPHPPRASAAKRAPVIRVYEPIREAQHPRTDDSEFVASTAKEPNSPTEKSSLPEAVHRSVFLATRTDRLQRTSASGTRAFRRHDMLASRVVATLDSLPRPKPMASTADRTTVAQSDTDRQLSAARAPQLTGFVQIAERDPVTGTRQFEKQVSSEPRKITAEQPRQIRPPVTQTTSPPIEARPMEAAIAPIPGTGPGGTAEASLPSRPSAPREQTFDVASALPRRLSPVVELATDPIITQSPSFALPSRQALASKPGPILKLAEESLSQRPALTEAVDSTPLPTATAQSVIQMADAGPLLAVLQPSPSASDLPAPRVESPLSEEQLAIAKGIEAFELSVKPINELSVRTKPEAGELPRDYASARFAREGEVAHRMGFSRSEIETTMMWEAPAICHRPLYYEDINLERHGYKVPVLQPALSAAHFFGRVPLLPYMMVSEGHRRCQYTLGHYRPGDYAPYSLYIPRLRLDASAAELAVAAGVIFAFP